MVPTSTWKREGCVRAHEWRQISACAEVRKQHLGMRVGRGVDAVTEEVARQKYRFPDCLNSLLLGREKKKNYFLPVKGRFFFSSCSRDRSRRLVNPWCCRSCI